MTRARDVANIDGILTTTGDTFYASSGGTPARLGIGSTDQVLKVSGGVPTWATPSSPSFVGAAVFNNNVSNTFTSGTALILGLDAESFDTNGFHDNVTNNSRITIPTGYAGKYMIIGHWDLNGVSSYYIGQIRKNGSAAVNGTNRQFAQNAGGNNFAAGDAVIIDTANVGDYYELSMQLGQSGTLVSNYYRLQAIYLGA